MRNVPYTKLLSSSKRAEKKLVRACKWFAMRLGPMELRRVNNYRPRVLSAPYRHLRLHHITLLCLKEFMI